MQKTAGSVSSKHTEARAALEENCLSPAVRRSITVHCKHFRPARNRTESAADGGKVCWPTMTKRG